MMIEMAIAANASCPPSARARIVERSGQASIRSVVTGGGALTARGGSFFGKTVFETGRTEGVDSFWWAAETSPSAAVKQNPSALIACVTALVKPDAPFRPI